MTHFDSVVKEKEFLSLDPDDIYNLLLKASFVVSEEVACKGALRWLEYESKKVSNRHQHLEKILTTIRVEIIQYL